LKSIRGGDVDKKQQEKSLLPETITLKTSEGDLRIKLRPDLSLESVQYIQKLLEDPNPCSHCEFYRAEKPGILQGVLETENVKPNTVLGKCPEGLSGKKHECPEHDPNCGCHGPIMKRGMIAWAAGEGGPDFFIDTYIPDATWWNTDHTVWGELADADSLAVAMGMYDLPRTLDKEDEITYLDEAVHIDISSS
jgi:cyclophilin family peptidyl-prolyl cis-trans isomerase